MYSFLIRFIRRLKAAKQITANSNTSFYFSKEIDFHLHPSSSIIIKKGVTLIGVNLDPKFPHATKSKSIIALGMNSKLIIEDNLIIAPGCEIRIKDNGVLTFCGENRIDHNFSITCTNKITIGYRTLMSWNITIIDDHGHTWIGPNEKRIKGSSLPMNIGKNVGLLMNTTLLNGIQIGDNSIIGPNLVLRKSAPENCMVYHNPDLKIKKGFKMLPIGESES